jgi:hypothetical protein
VEGHGSFRAAEAAAGPSADIEVIRILLGLAILASFLGGAVGPGIWRALGLGG